AAVRDGRGELLVGERTTGLVLRRQMRRRADAVDLPARLQAPAVFVRPAVHAELQARRARVEHQRVVVHVGPARSQRGGCRRACAASTATAQLAMRDRRLSARLVRMTGTFAPSTGPALSAFARKLSCLA